MITDKQRIDWLQKHGKDGWSLIGDENGKWAVSMGGMSIMPDGLKTETVRRRVTSMMTAHGWMKSFLIDPSEWRPTVRKAIDRAIKEVK